MKIKDISQIKMEMHKQKMDLKRMISAKIK